MGRRGGGERGWERREGEGIEDGEGQREVYMTPHPKLSRAGRGAESYRK